MFRAVELIQIIVLDPRFHVAYSWMHTALFILLVQDVRLEISVLLKQGDVMVLEVSMAYSIRCASRNHVPVLSILVSYQGRYL